MLKYDNDEYLIVSLLPLPHQLPFNDTFLHFKKTLLFRLFLRIFNSSRQKNRNVRSFSLKKKIIERFESGYECLMKC